MKLRAIPHALGLVNSIRKVDRFDARVAEARARGPEEERKAIAMATDYWSDIVARKFLLNVQVKGEENIPKEDGVVFISNHQGYADIIALFLAMPGKQLGFIAKDSLEKVPYLGRWIKNIRGLFIRRGDAKEALRSIREGADLLKQGYNLVIFPEGTRSRGGPLGEFKSGSFKLATMAKAPIVPVTIDGTWHLYEEKGYPQPANASVTIHPAIETAPLSRKEISEMENNVRDMIAAELEVKKDGI